MKYVYHWDEITSKAFPSDLISYEWYKIYESFLLKVLRLIKACLTKIKTSNSISLNYFKFFFFQFFFFISDNGFERKAKEIMICSITIPYLINYSNNIVCNLTIWNKSWTIRSTKYLLAKYTYMVSLYLDFKNYILNNCKNHYENRWV